MGLGKMLCKKMGGPILMTYMSCDGFLHKELLLGVCDYCTSVKILVALSFQIVINFLHALV